MAVLCNAVGCVFKILQLVQRDAAMLLWLVVHSSVIV
jgi:hypothetical protein